MDSIHDMNQECGVTQMGLNEVNIRSSFKPGHNDGMDFSGCILDVHVWNVYPSIRIICALVTENVSVEVENIVLIVTETCQDLHQDRNQPLAPVNGSSNIRHDTFSSQRSLRSRNFYVVANSVRSTRPHLFNHRIVSVHKFL